MKLQNKPDDVFFGIWIVIAGYHEISPVTVDVIVNTLCVGIVVHLIQISWKINGIVAICTYQLLQ